MSPQPKCLLLVPAPLDFGIEPTPPIEDLLPQATLRAAAGLRHWVVENAKTARALLKRIHAVHALALPLQELELIELPRAPKGSKAEPDFRPLLAPLRAGHMLGLLSEAGLPAVADPGARLVALAHAEGFGVQSLPGSSSLLQALAASGLEGQRFAFHGYLPQDAAERQARIRQLEQQSRQQQQTQIAIETPYRNPALLSALLQSLQPGSRLAVSLSLTTEREWTRSDTVANWRASASTLPSDQPAIFSWLAS